MARFAVILPAAGRSSRFGGHTKKPFVTLDGTAVWLRTAELFLHRPEVSQVLLVVSPEDRDDVRQRFGVNLMFLNIKLVDGGAERFASVANALSHLPEDADFVAIHDAVRPCTPPPAIDAVFAAAVEHGAALLGLPVADTLKRVDGETVTATVPRDNLWQAQTPQVFRRDWLTAAHAQRGELTVPITDDAQLVEAMDHPVRIVRGSPLNLKITEAEDLKLASLFLRRNEVAEEKPRHAHPFDDDRFD